MPVAKKIALAAPFVLSFSLLAGCWPGNGGESKPDIGDDIVVSGFSQAYQDFETAVDIEFSRAVMEELARLGDDPATGFRTAGSPAERAAADVVERAMREAGLANVTRETAHVDGWVFTGAAITWQDRKGAQQSVRLGGYPVNLVVQDEVFLLVDLGDGTEAAYAEADVAGKLVLIDVDPAVWELRYPVYQAKLKGAKAVLACISSEGVDGETLRSADLRGPSDAPVFAVSADAAAALRSEIRHAEKRELPVIFSANSVVTGGAPTENIWGEIPGRGDGVIYVLCNYDGFYHSVFENAAGLSASLGIAKALHDSEFLPNKTLRFVAHGAGAWGAANTLFSRGAGAWKQISELHPEWAASAFAALHIGGAFPLANETRFGAGVADEISPFIVRNAEQLLGNSMYSFSWYGAETLSGLMTEELPWLLGGVPTVAAKTEETGKFYKLFHNSSADSVEAAGFDDDAYRFNHLLYGKLILDLDGALIRPLDFDVALQALSASLADTPFPEVALTGALLNAVNTASALAEGIEKMNLEYMAASEAVKPGMEAMAFGLNLELFHINKEIKDAFLRLAPDGTLYFPHVAAGENVLVLRQAREELNGQGTEAAEIAEAARTAAETLKGLESSRYADAFAPAVCDYFAGLGSAGTWAEGRTSGPPCRADDVIRGLKQKIAGGEPDLGEETEAVELLLVREEVALNEILAEERAQVQLIEVHMKQVLEDYLSVYQEEANG
jgi:hypothetical protein